MTLVEQLILKNKQQGEQLKRIHFLVESADPDTYDIDTLLTMTVAELDELIETVSD